MKSKVARGNASQFFVAGQLCRRGYSAVVTLGNTPNTDILCSNIEGTKFVHIQVKTFRPGDRGVHVGKKSEIDYGKNFIWVLAGIPFVDAGNDFEYFIIPSKEMAKNVQEGHSNWLSKKGRDGQPRKDSTVRILNLPPYKESYNGWKIEKYRNNWNLIDNLLA